MPIILDYINKQKMSSLKIDNDYILVFRVRENGEGFEEPESPLGKYNLTEITLFSGQMLELDRDGRKVAVKVKGRSPAEATLLGDGYGDSLSLDDMRGVVGNETNYLALLLRGYQQSCNISEGRNPLLKTFVIVDNVNGRYTLSPKGSLENRLIPFRIDEV